MLNGRLGSLLAVKEMLIERIPGIEETLFYTLVQNLILLLSKSLQTESKKRVLRRELI